ncbi:MAG TPA: fructosamine kinase family protein [Burkholderiales bacterium]|nr:fructosamine kinase family protein [Burkholderiales bacterium]
MPLWTDIAGSITRSSGQAFAIEDRQAIGGGCINTAYRVGNGGRVFFVKTNAPQNHDMFAAEAAGLREIAHSGTMRVPQPVCDGCNDEASWLVLEYIEFGGGGNGRALGERLAAMHRVTAAGFGWQRDNTIGATPQINAWCDDWLEFWRRHRLGFQLRLAAENGAPRRMVERGERLLADCAPLLAGREIAPSLLHGDLWGGNTAVDTHGDPVLFDPAVYYGDREADLAMTELFGGFGRDFYAAYDAAYPRAPGYPARRTFYNLYHVLNHFNLFGGGYAQQAAAMIEASLAELR